MKAWFILGIGLAVAGCGAPCLGAQEGVAENELLRTEGEVSQTDWVNNKIAVKGLDGEMVFSLTPDTKVMDQTQEVVQADIEQGQHVEVYYVNEPDGAAKAIRIIITDSIA